MKGFNRSGLRYMLTGALASSYYGRPRTTMDIDIVVRASRKQLSKLARALKNANLKVDVEKMERAWQLEDRIVTLEDKNSPHTVDIIFTDEKLERKAASILGLPTFYQMPESLIPAKLRMTRLGHSSPFPALCKDAPLLMSAS